MNQQDYRLVPVVEKEITHQQFKKHGLFRLPPEIRLQLWTLCLPRERVLRIAFRADNDRKRGFAMGPRNIPTILHVCRESRKYGQTVLRMGFGTQPTVEDTDWWNPDRDVLYLPPWQPPQTWDLRTSFNFQDFEENFPFPLHRDDSEVGSSFHHTSLAPVRHLALPFNYKILNGIKFSEESESWLLPWLKKFPHLESVKLLIDNVPQWYRAGDIQLYRPLDVPLNVPLPNSILSFNTPSRIEMKVIQKLQEFRQDTDTNWKVPKLELLVMGNTERKEQCGFRLPIAAV